MRLQRLLPVSIVARATSTEAALTAPIIRLALSERVRALQLSLGFLILFRRIYRVVDSHQAGPRT